MEGRRKMLRSIIPIRTLVRIDDTVLVTKRGCQVLTKNVPKGIDEVERLLQGSK